MESTTDNNYFTGTFPLTLNSNNKQYLNHCFNGDVTKAIELLLETLKYEVLTNSFIKVFELSFRQNKNFKQSFLYTVSIQK